MFLFRLWISFTASLLEQGISLVMSSANSNLFVCFDKGLSEETEVQKKLHLQNWCYIKLFWFWFPLMITCSFDSSKIASIKRKYDFNPFLIKFHGWWVMSKILLIWVTRDNQIAPDRSQHNQLWFLKEMARKYENKVKIIIIILFRYCTAWEGFHRLRTPNKVLMQKMSEWTRDLTVEATNHCFAVDFWIESS